MKAAVAAFSEKGIETARAVARLLFSHGFRKASA